MPGIVVSIDGKSTGFERELAKAEAAAVGMAKNTAKQVEGIAIASQVQLQKQLSMLDQLKAKVDSIRGGGMMSAADSAKMDERLRQTEVEEASRRNRARKLKRERALDAKEAKIEAYKAEKEAIFAAYEGGGNSQAVFQERRIQRRLEKSKMDAARQAAANFIGPTATIQQLDMLAANSGKKAGSGWFSNFTANLQGHGSGGIQQLIHVGRATVDSLASGMSPWRVMMQQGPQAFQAFASMGGTAALKFIAAFGAAFAAIGGIIAAPFIYFSRENGLVERLAPRKLIDFAREYVPLVDKTSDGLYRMAKAAQRVSEEYNGATASAARYQKQLDEQYETQKQLDSLRKESEIIAARGNQQRIAEIENRYGQLEVSRAKEKSAADKQNKINEAEALKKELADLEKRKAAITVGDEGKRKQVMETAKARAEAAQKLLDEENQRQVDEQSQTFLGRGANRAGKFLKNLYQSGGGGLAMLGPAGTISGFKKANELGETVDAARQKDLELARQNVLEYQKLKNAEDARNKAIEERNRLQGDSEKNAARLAQLQKEIAAADKESERANKNLQSIEDAKAANRKQAAVFGGGSGSGAASITERERIGARSGSGVTVSLLEVSKKHLRESEKHTTNLAEIAKALHEGGY